MAWVRTLWGGKLLLDTRDLLIAPYLLLDGIWEPETTRFVQQVLKPGMTFVDVGANLGYYTILGAQLVGSGGRVFAFEAQRETHELLTKNAIVNWVAGFTTTENKAVFSHTCNLDFFVRKYYPGNSSIGSVSADHLQRHFDSQERTQVAAVSLDDYFANGHHIDLIKLDVEGAEVQAFRGMARLLEQNTDVVIICEWAQEQLRDTGSDPAELVEEFKRHRFTPFLIADEPTRLSTGDLLEMESPHNLALIRQRGG